MSMKRSTPSALPWAHRPMATPAPMTRRQLKNSESNMPAVGPMSEALMAFTDSLGIRPAATSRSNA